MPTKKDIEEMNKVYEFVEVEIESKLVKSKIEDLLWEMEYELSNKED